MIKKETRILGLCAATGRLHPIPVIGIVFRGNLWFDGIFTCQVRPREHDFMSGLVKAIVQSKQYSQIRAIILSSEDIVSGVRIDISDFSHKVNLPVITIARRTLHRQRPNSRTDYFSIKTAGGLVHVKISGMSREKAHEIFAVACAEGQQIPEAVRVARIVATHVTERQLISYGKDWGKLSPSTSKSSWSQLELDTTGFLAVRH